MYNKHSSKCDTKQKHMLGLMQDTEFKKANKDELRSLFGYLEFCLTQIVKDNELGALEQVRSDLKGLLCSGLLCCASPD